MSPSELFDIWAPSAAPWSRWAKPVLFAELDPPPVAGVDLSTSLAVNVPIPQHSAIVVDLPSAESVPTGLALAQLNYRPVPLFNGARGPRPLTNLAAAIVDNEPIVAWLRTGADLLAKLALPDEAPPAFLLDARRKPEALKPAPGRFDNRWIVFPQDFPSANFLRTHGIQQVLLLQSEPERQPQADLAHVLRRWQEAGLPLFVSRPDDPSPPRPLQVARPSGFRSLWYGVLALAGLRRNSAGGFGSIVPLPSSSG